MNEKALLILRPSRDNSVELWTGFALGMAATAVVLLLPRMKDLSQYSFEIYLAAGIVAVLGIVIAFGDFMPKQGAKVISYEIFSDRLRYNYKHVPPGRTPIPETRSLDLPYFEIISLEQVQSPRQAERGVANIHMKISTPGVKRMFCELFESEFFLYDIKTGDQPLARIQEIMDRHFRENPQFARAREELMYRNSLAVGGL